MHCNARSSTSISMFPDPVSNSRAVQMANQRLWQRQKQASSSSTLSPSPSSSSSNELVPFGMMVRSEDDFIFSRTLETQQQRQQNISSNAITNDDEEDHGDNYSTTSAAERLKLLPTSFVHASLRTPNVIYRQVGWKYGVGAILSAHQEQGQDVEQEPQQEQPQQRNKRRTAVVLCYATDGGTAQRIVYDDIDFEYDHSESTSLVVGGRQGFTSKDQHRKKQKRRTVLQTFHGQGCRNETASSVMCMEAIYYKNSTHTGNNRQDDGGRQQNGIGQNDMRGPHKKQTVCLMDGKCRCNDLSNYYRSLPEEGKTAGNVLPSLTQLEYADFPVHLVQEKNHPQMVSPAYKYSCWYEMDPYEPEPMKRSSLVDSSLPTSQSLPSSAKREDQHSQNRFRRMEEMIHSSNSLWMQRDQWTYAKDPTQYYGWSECLLRVPEAANANTNTDKESNQNDNRNVGNKDEKDRQNDNNDNENDEAFLPNEKHFSETLQIDAFVIELPPNNGNNHDRTDSKNNDARHQNNFIAQYRNILCDLSTRQRLVNQLTKLQHRYGNLPVLLLEERLGIRQQKEQEEKVRPSLRGGTNHSTTVDIATTAEVSTTVHMDDFNYCQDMWDDIRCLSGYRKQFVAQPLVFADGSCLAVPDGCRDVYFFPAKRQQQQEQQEQGGQKLSSSSSSLLQGIDGTTIPTFESCNITIPKHCLTHHFHQNHRKRNDVADDQKTITDEDDNDSNKKIQGDTIVEVHHRSQGTSHGTSQGTAKQSGATKTKTTTTTTSTSTTKMDMKVTMSKTTKTTIAGKDSTANASSSTVQGDTTATNHHHHDRTPDSHFHNISASESDIPTISHVHHHHYYYHHQQHMNVTITGSSVSAYENGRTMLRFQQRIISLGFFFFWLIISGILVRGGDKGKKRRQARNHRHDNENQHLSVDQSYLQHQHQQ